MHHCQVRGTGQGECEAVGGPHEAAGGPVKRTKEKIEKMFKMFQGIKPEGSWSSFVGFREVNGQTLV